MNYKGADVWAIATYEISRQIDLVHFSIGEIKYYYEMDHYNEYYLLLF